MGEGGIWRVTVRKDYMAWETKTLVGTIYQDSPGYTQVTAH